MVLDSDLISIQEARIAVEESKRSLYELRLQDLETQDRFIKEFSKKILNNLDKLASLEYKTTHRGNIEDNIKLIETTVKKLNKQYLGKEFYGKIKDTQFNNKYYGVPKGTVVSLLPQNLIVATAIHNIFTTVKSGCPIILVPTREGIEIINYLIGLLRSDRNNYDVVSKSIYNLSNVSKLGKEILLKDQTIKYVLDHQDFVDEKIATYISGEVFKSYMGINPVFIEGSADYKNAVKAIIESKKFMNGLLPGSEQALVVEKKLDKDVRAELIKEGGYFLTSNESEKLSNSLFYEDGSVKDVFIGRSALEIADMSNITVPQSTEILIIPEEFVSIYSKFINLKPVPVLSYYIEDDWQNGCEKCIELILNNSTSQALSIYSEDSTVIDQFIMLKPVPRVLVNTSTGFGSTGISTEFNYSLSLNNKACIDGLNGNFNPAYLINNRCVGYEKEYSNTSESRNNDDVKIEEFFIKIMDYIEDFNKEEK